MAERTAAASRGRLRARAATLVLVAGLSGCQGCCSGGVCEWPETPESPPQESASGLRIVPDEVWTSPGASFDLRLHAVDAEGLRVPIPSGSASWTAGPGASVAEDGPGALVKIDAGASTGSIPVAVALGGLSSSATVHLGSASDGDAVSTDVPASPEPPSALLLEACEGGASVRLLLPVVGRAELGRNLDASCAGTGRAAAFATAFAGDIRTWTASPWTAGRDVLSLTGTPPPRTVEVELQIHTGSVGTLQDAELDLEGIAAAILREARVGVDVRIASTSQSPQGRSVNVAWCADPTSLQTLGVDLTKVALFVVYVTSIEPEKWRGYTCPRPAGQAAGVIFMAPSASPTTAAHELGHALGLAAPLPGHGHSGNGYLNLFGFDADNLMWVGENPERPVARRHVSIGQVFRMHRDMTSWLVHQAGLPSEACSCKPYDSVPCPPLYLDFDDPGPAPSQQPLCTS